MRLNCTAHAGIGSKVVFVVLLWCLQVPGAVNIASIACGAFHNMALVADGRVLAWGTNDYGQLGNGSTIYSTTPVEVS
jgi:alpha-tubulin suppressor-like RCC1 family protein